MVSTLPKSHSQAEALNRHDRLELPDHRRCRYSSSCAHLRQHVAFIAILRPTRSATSWVDNQTSPSSIFLPRSDSVN